MSTPDDRSYTSDHEWVASGSPARVGITAYAAESLGDIVFVDLPELGATVTAGETCAEVESTKSVSDIIAPLSGTVVAVNQLVVDDPALVNADPYGEGWLFELDATAGTGELLTAGAYDALIADA